MTLSELRAAIPRAFGELVAPPKERIACCACPECSVLREVFAGRKWNEVPRDLIERNHDKLPLFSPEALRYYLPSYLSLALDAVVDYSPDEVDNDLVLEFTIYALCPGNDEPRSGTWERERWQMFSGEQMAVVTDFLMLLKDDARFYAFHKIIERGLPRIAKHRSHE